MTLYLNVTRSKIIFLKVKSSRKKHSFFSKGQPFLRSSPLAKRYGFGIHHNKEGKVAIFAVDSKEYQNFLSDETIKKVKAMRSKKK
ncbi:MAG: DUF6157 family protein [Chryseobacterium sp.]|nr:DUF6157 family protein [Chryseobacterium sp.]MDN5481706.1 DUF6157 family protein [Chryseobacterium sp.]